MIKIKFYADWCLPCRAMSALMESNGLKVDREVNVEEEPEFAERLGIRALPTLVKYDEETQSVISKLIGSASLNDIKEFLEG